MSELRIGALTLCLVACGHSGPYWDDLDASVAGDDAQAHGDAAQMPTKSATIDVRLIAPGFSETPETQIAGGFIKQKVCAHSTVGSCEVVRCEHLQRDVLAAPGKLHVSFVGGEYGWDPGAFPLLFSANAITWAAGEPVKVRTEGEAVPAFTTQANSPTTLDAGYNGPLFSVAFARTAPLHMTWTPSNGDVIVTMEQNTDSNDTSHVTIECTGNGPSGALDVPAAALSKLSYTDGSIIDEVRSKTWHVNTSTVTAGDYAVRVRVMRAYTDQTTYFKPMP